MKILSVFRGYLLKDKEKHIFKFLLPKDGVFLTQLLARKLN